MLTPPTRTPLTHVVSYVSTGPRCTAFAAFACASVRVTVVRYHATPSKSLKPATPLSFHDPVGVTVGHALSSKPGAIHARCAAAAGSCAVHQASLRASSARMPATGSAPYCLTASTPAV